MAFEHLTVLSLLLVGLFSQNEAIQTSGNCEAKEQLGLALNRDMLTAPATIIEVYHDVTTKEECYERCCSFNKRMSPLHCVLNISFYQKVSNLLLYVILKNIYNLKMAQDKYFG